MIKVCHLIASCMTNHGPSGGILAQIAHTSRGDASFAVWSMYLPPPDRDPGAVVRGLGAEWRCLGMGRGFADVRVLPTLVRALRRERFDVIHCHLVRANLYGRLAARLAGVPVTINTLRNVEDYFTSPNLASGAVRAAERRTASWVTRYVAVSEGVRAAAVQYLRLPAAQVVTILNAVDLALFAGGRPDRARLRAQLELRPDAVVVGSVGSLEPRKNYGALLRAVALLATDHPELQVVIFGDGPERSTLDGLIHELHLANSVRMAGFRADVVGLLPALDIFAMPSLGEGLPRAVMEASASGLPCVVTDVGGNREAVADWETGFVVPSGDLERLVGALRRLVGDAALRARFGEAARHRAAMLFSPARMAGEYLTLYRILLGPHAAARPPHPEAA